MKSVTKGEARTQVLPRLDDDRGGEVARMLSGDTITEAARAAAKALLQAR